MTENMLNPDWRPRLVALDIDGTVVDHDGRLPQEVYDAVHRVLAADTPVVLATGRGWHGTRVVFDALELPPGYAVASNGAVLVTYPPTEIVRQVTFDPSDVIDRIGEVAPDALIGIEDIGVGYRVSGDFPQGDLQGETTVESLDSLRSRPVPRVIVRDPNKGAHDFIALAERLGLHGVSYYIGYSAWLDIAPEGVHKATGLAQVCDELGIAQSDVLAMGDGRNDVEMLQWAGRGVAIGDAPTEVQEIADHVTGLFREGGTVAELNRWF